MEWLNRIDDVLDSAFRPRKGSRSTPGQVASSPQSTEAETDATGQDRYSVVPPPQSGGDTSWQQGFVEHNHRLVSAVNQEETIDEKLNMSASPSHSAKGLTRAPGRLKRVRRSFVEEEEEEEEPPSVATPPPSPEPLLPSTPHGENDTVENQPTVPLQSQVTENSDIPPDVQHPVSPKIPVDNETTSSGGDTGAVDRTGNTKIKNETESEQTPSLSAVINTGVQEETQMLDRETAKVEVPSLDTNPQSPSQSASPPAMVQEVVEPEEEEQQSSNDKDQSILSSALPPDVSIRINRHSNQSTRPRMSPVQEEANEAISPKGETTKSLGALKPLLPPSPSRLIHSDMEEISLLSDTHAVPRQIEFRSEFDVRGAIEAWEEDTAAPPFVASMNCFGVVHVRVLRAQRLPCPVGSSVQAIVSLPPWKGRIRTTKVSAFAGAGRSGVCTDWSNDEAAISMVHAYSSEESPVPSIKIKLVFGTLGVFEFGICSLELSCEPLLRLPMVAKRQWFRTTPEGKERSENIPLIQIEAMFEPDIKESPEFSQAPVQVVQVRKFSAEDSYLDATSSPLASVAATSVHTPQPPAQRTTVSERSLPPVVEAKMSFHEVQEAVASASPQRESQQSHRTKTNDEKSDLSVSVMSRKAASSVSANFHLLRTKAFYTPTWCLVCGKSIMSGVWKVPSFRCEECIVHCCGDCRLQVDIQLPCGSLEAQQAVREATEAQFTTEKFLQMVAPVEESTDQSINSALAKIPQIPKNRLSADGPGIGKLKINFLQACVLSEPIPAESGLDFGDSNGLNLRRGDYYIRIVSLERNDTARTRTVQQSSRPQFDSSDFIICVPNFTSTYRVELVDASDDTPVGFLVFTAQMLLQEQRDDAIKHSSFFLRRMPYEKRRTVRELRRFVKSGSPNEYFPAIGSRTAGAVIGLIEFNIVLEEDFAALYGPHPYSCPARPKDELDLGTVKFHIQRISHLIGEVKAMLAALEYMTSWENPLLTFASLYFFAAFCLKVHPDHFFTGPLFLVLCFLGYLAFWRFRGGLAKNFHDEELASSKKLSRMSVDYTLHRPVGLVKAIVRGGRNMRSPELGLTGSVSCRVSLDLARSCNEGERRKLSKVEGAAGAVHTIGSTESLFSTHPKWKFLEESEESKRIKALIPSQQGFFESKEVKNQPLSSLEFPVLQPIVQDSHENEVELRPWSASSAAIVFEVMFSDIASVRVIPGSEYSLGEAVIPLSKLVEEGEIEDWFTLSPSADTDFASMISHLADRPAIKLFIKWLPPTKVEGLPAEVEREASIVVQEELCRAVAHAQKKQVSLIGSSLGAIDSVRGVSNYLLAIQNGLGDVLEVIEGVKNLFNFTDPAKSLLVVSAGFLAWVILYWIPFRLLVLILGSIPYILALKSRLVPIPSKRQKVKSSSRDESLETPKSSSIATWVNNFIRSLPIDEDIRRTYYWETQRKVAKQLREDAETRRSSRLQKLWRSQWHDNVGRLQRPSDSKLPPKLESAFAVIQGRRFMVWKSAEEFDDGEKPASKLFLQGHAGLSTPSPIELKTIGKDAERAISLFGRGTNGQERITILTSGAKSKEVLENVVLAALNTKDD